jgi:hypothetical protein
MKKRSVGVIAVLVIARSAVKRFKKWIVGGMFAVTIVAFSMFNVSLNSQGSLSAVYKANVEALSNESPWSGTVFCSRQGDNDNDCQYSNPGNNWGVCYVFSSPLRCECLNSSTHDCNGTFSCPCEF